MLMLLQGVYLEALYFLSFSVSSNYYAHVESLVLEAKNKLGFRCWLLVSNMLELMFRTKNLILGILSFTVRR